VEIYKGIYELIEAYGLLKLKYPKMKLTIAGNGHELENVVKHIEMNNYIDIIISGYLTGDAKYELLASGNLFVFPSYSEGMPNAVLEGMAVGLPIVTTKVGGLNDFFENGIMGSYIEIKNVNSIVKEISHLYENQELRNTISKYNIKFAFEKFNASTVAKKYLSI
jgi:glycosyltransferase involved in cell wall biosynthesis